MNSFLAHAGVEHGSVSEAVSHGINLSDAQISILYWITLIAVPLLGYIILKKCKSTFSTNILLFSTFLIVFSIVSYQHPGLYSVVALATGFGITLLATIAGLSTKQH